MVDGRDGRCVVREGHHSGIGVGPGLYVSRPAAAARSFCEVWFFD